MKKSAFFLSVLSIAVFAGSYAHAEDMSPDSDDQMQMRRKGGGQGMMEGKEGMHKGGMMGMGMHPSVTATSDGGVVILSGGKLSKYDSNLNLVKEVELKKDKPHPHGAAPDENAPRTVRQQVAAEADVPVPQFAPVAESAPAPDAPQAEAVENVIGQDSAAVAPAPETQPEPAQ